MPSGDAIASTPVVKLGLFDHLTGGSGNAPSWGIIHVMWMAARWVAVAMLAVLVVFFVLVLLIFVLLCFFVAVWPFCLRVLSSGAVDFASRG